jgi:DNA mismatch repair protein MutL
VSETPEIKRAASRIRILPDRVASQIAAGEVVERPVAVVKELVENSLDAGARRVDIRFEQGGRRLVSVEDDGCGMCPDDALLSLERHATSKLREAADLNSVHSFGFRGEALPSIASVSRFTMRTRAAGWAEGMEVFVDNGSVAHAKAFGMALGTRIEVAHLFESVPARRKFLKSDRTESAHIVLCARLLAVAHPEVAFSLTEDARTLFRSPACAGLTARVAEVFGRDWAADLAPVDAEGGGVRLRGLVSRPGRGRTSRAEMFWFANSRPVENRTLSAALMEACRGFIASGRFPAGFLFIELDPAAIDVNVHPAKREIRLRDEAQVRSFVTAALAKRMEELARELSQGLASSTPAITPTTPAKVVAPTPAVTPAAPRVPARMPEAEASVQTLARASRPVHAAKPAPAGWIAAGTSSAPASRAVASDALPARWRYIGTTHGNFILFETPDGLLILNRTAAQTRVLYEDYMQSLITGHIVTQALLFPRLFELPILLADVLARHLDFFRASGFAVEGFGATSFRVSSLPAWFEGEGCEDFIHEAVARIAENGIRPDRDAQLARETFARLAAAHAAAGSAPVDEQSGLSLARKLLACKNPLADPKGNPTYIEMSRAELTGKRG